MLDVGRYADDLTPAVRASVAYALADRVFVREMPARGRLADDDDIGRVLVVTFGELTPRNEPYAHRAEIVRTHGADPRHRPLIGLWLWTAFNQKSGVSVVAQERKRRNRRGRLHAGQRLNAFQKLAVEVPDLSIVINRHRQCHDGGQHVVGVEAGIDSLKPDEASDQQP